MVRHRNGPEHAFDNHLLLLSPPRMHWCTQQPQARYQALLLRVRAFNTPCLDPTTFVYASETARVWASLTCHG